MANMVDIQTAVCPVCGSRDFQRGKGYVDRMEHIEDYDVVCSECGYVIGLNSDGSFDFHDEDLCERAYQEWLKSEELEDEDKED